MPSRLPTAALCLILATTVSAQTTDPATVRIDSALRALERRASVASCASIVRAPHCSSAATGWPIAKPRRPSAPAPSFRSDRTRRTSPTVALLQLHERGRLEHSRLAREVLSQRAGGQTQHHALAARAAHRRLPDRTRRRLRAAVAPGLSRRRDGERPLTVHTGRRASSTRTPAMRFLPP